MHWNSYCTSLVSYRSCYCLPYPPSCISRKLKITAIFKLVNSFLDLFILAQLCPRWGFWLSCVRLFSDSRFNWEFWLWNLVFLSCTYWSLIGFSIFKILCINAMASPVRWYPSIVSNFGRWLMSLATIIGVREVSEWYDKFTHLLK